MSGLTMQRDLVVSLKKETFLNVGILSKFRPMPPDISRQIFRENALEKPTQNLFNHLSHYLVSIIDNQACAAFSWPLYDTKTERAYRKELSAFISDYSTKGLLSPVMSSYLVNPGCYKVVMLVFQMSQLAVQRMLLSKMEKDSQRKRYKDMTERYKSPDMDSFIETIEKETVTMSSKLPNYLCKREVMEKIAELLRKRITEMEDKLKSLNVQKYLNNLVETFLKKYNVDENTKTEILKVSNVNTTSVFFDAYLLEMDTKITEMESKWNDKVTPILELSKDTQNYSKQLIARQTCEADRSTYMLEFNPKTDDLCTTELESQVNSEQKYILKNIIKDGKLNFPNLIRGFVIAMCFVLKNTEIGDEIYNFNEYLEGGSRSYKELVSAMRILLNRVMNAESKLQPTQVTYNPSILYNSINEIPPLPDLTNLKMSREFHSQIISDNFTPLNLPRHRFNLHRKSNSMFAKPLSKALMAPVYQKPRDDFLKSLISCRVTGYDRPNITQNLNMTQINPRNNETVAERTGFTKDQLMRLLSTKKSSSSKKLRNKTERTDIHVRKGGLYNDSIVSDNKGLYRSYSSPNLLVNREKRSRIGRNFQEHCPLLEVSGIMAFSKDNSFGTPENVVRNDNGNILNATSLPFISISPAQNAYDIKPNEIPVNSHEVHFADLNIQKLQEHIKEDDELKTETPKTNAQLVRKTSSLEKIISRFKKVRANVMTSDKNEDDGDFRTIIEEKENFTPVNVDVIKANRVLLPDLLSPSCSAIIKSTDNVDVSMEDEVVCRKPRESLGTMLGVDQTFLDQFDLID